MLLTFQRESFDLLVFYSVIILNLVLFFEIINIIYIYIYFLYKALIIMMTMIYSVSSGLRKYSLASL